MTKYQLIILLMLLFAGSLLAQRNYFQTISPTQLPQAREATKQVIKKGIYRLDEKALRTYLLNAPIEFKNNGRTIPLEIPLPDGTIEIFNMVESPVLSEKMAAEHPEIKTYTGNGQKEKTAVIRISLTSTGLSAVILNLKDDAVYFEPWSASQPGYYFNYFSKDAIVPPGGLRRQPELTPPGQPGRPPVRAPSNAPQKNQRSFTTGSTLTTYRLAMAANGEFVAQHGGTVNSGFNTVVAYVNRIIAFYRNELAVNFTLVSGTDVIYTNAVTDPYNNNSQSAMLGQNISNLNSMLGVNGYDIGHVWGYAGGSGGGVAYTGSLGYDTYKGGGVSGEGNLGNYAQVFMDQLVLHEMGHQFGMSHSYNSSIPVCTTREPETSVEPGSGATIMSYGFTCGDDDYFETSTPKTGPILAFHTVNYAQAVDYMASLSGIGIVTSTGNTAPAVTVPASFTIPRSTPFSLTGSATDANGDALSYSWEGTNIGTVTPDGTTLENTAQPPFFRSYLPSTSPTRYYPLLESILSGSNYAKGDKLPSVGIVTTHEFTVRDNNAAGGGVSSGSVTVTVNGNIGPFLITSNLGAGYPGNSSQTVTWSVNGTNTATPNVKISLSTDGGFTFPTVLAASTPNDGTQAVTMPDISTSSARIKVEAVGNIYFDISNSNFSITPVANTFTITATSGANGTVTPEGATSVTSGGSQTYTITPAACYQVAGLLIDGSPVAPAGTYTFSNVTSSHTISATFSLRTYAIASGAGVNGTITPSGATNVNCGANQTYTIAPAAGYAIQNVLVDGASQGATGSYTFSNVTATHTISASFITNAGIITYRINAGGPQVTNSIGIFAADNYFSPSPGFTSATSTAIAGTTDDAIYQTERYSTAGILNYAFPVTNGQYKVVMHFAEIFFTGQNQRVFDVSIEGSKVLDNFDILKKVAANTATTETFNANVTDGTLNVYLSSLASDGGLNSPKLSAIEVIQTFNLAPVANAGPDQTISLPTSTATLSGSGTDPGGSVVGYTWSQLSGPNTAVFDDNSIASPTISGLIAGSYWFSLVVTDNESATSQPEQVLITVNPAGNTPLYRINAGGPQVTNSIGVYAADNYYSPSPGNTYSTSAAIAGTIDDAIYQTERFSSTGVLNYAFPVATGQYKVVLHFAEIYLTGINQRVFDVSLEGSKILDNYDILEKVGPNTATTETFNTTVNDGTLNIYFSSLAADGGSNNVKVSAIEIIQISPNPAPIANAGPDQIISLPTSTATLSGSGTDAGGAIAGYTWSQVSGPNVAVFNNTSLQSPTVSGLIAGAYWFSLVVTDNQMAQSAADLVLVTVNPAGNTPVYRVNAGGPQVTNSIGVFAVDAGYFSPAPGFTNSTTTAIAGTTDDDIYKTERYSTTGVLNYAFPVSNGQYRVIMHFAEIYFTSQDQRRFDVSIESTKVLDNYDILKKVAANTATTETFTTNVTDGNLNILFSSLAADGGSNSPKVSAIEILRIGAAPKTALPIAGMETGTGSLQKLNVRLTPNPAYDHVTFHITSGNSKSVYVRIFRADGKLMDSRSNLLPNGSVQLGNLYIPGLYYAEVMQGSEKVTVKFIKLKNQDR